MYWSQPEPRWPKSPPQDRRESGPELSEYPRPLRHTHSDRAPAGPPSGAEHMSPDPVEHYPDLWVDVLDTEVGEAEAETEVREAQPGRGERHARRTPDSAAGAASPTVAGAAAAAASFSAEPTLSKFPAAAVTMSGATVRNDIARLLVHVVLAAAILTWSLRNKVYS